MKYPLTLRVLHWTIAFLMIGLLIVGFTMTELLSAPFKYTFYDIHKALGLTVFGLVLLRIGVRLISDVPPTPNTVAKHERKLSKLVYLSLYILMVAFPLSGYVMSAAGGHPISWFGVDVPLILIKNDALAHTARELHEIFGYALAGIITLHFLGFLKHLIFDKENLLKRMW